MEPKTPKDVSPYAHATLMALAEDGLGEKISIGGAFGLAYYLEYRPTHDVDAWWDVLAGAEDRRRVILCLEQALGAYGEVLTRSWGDVVSIELVQGGQTVFSFQIAYRDGRLQPAVQAPWPATLKLDSLPDLAAAKMKALVERGAPRDFRDIFALCRAGLFSPQECWALWRRRQRLVGGDLSAARCRTAVQTHLARIELHRPLEQISDARNRAEAEEIRNWFRKEFVDALMD